VAQGAWGRGLRRGWALSRGVAGSTRRTRCDPARGASAAGPDRAQRAPAGGDRGRSCRRGRHRRAGAAQRRARPGHRQPAQARRDARGVAASQRAWGPGLARHSSGHPVASGLAVGASHLRAPGGEARRGAGDRRDRPSPTVAVGPTSRQLRAPRRRAVGAPPRRVVAELRQTQPEPSGDPQRRPTDRRRRQRTVARRAASSAHRGPRRRRALGLAHRRGARGVRARRGREPQPTRPLPPRRAGR
jgi:hypothetical protein